MSYDEFITLLTTSEPSIDDYGSVLHFAELADIKTLWSALNTKGIHWIFSAVISNVLREKVVKAKLDGSMQNIFNKTKSTE